MGSAIVKTAAATDAILAQTIQSAEVLLPSGKIRFYRHDGSQFDTDSLIGPQGNPGDVSAGTSGFSTLTQLLDRTGYGVLWHDKVTTLQSWADLSPENEWHTITGLSATFDQKVDRLYRVELDMLMLTEDPDGCVFAAEIIDGSTVVARFGNVATQDAQAVHVGGVLTFMAGATVNDQLFTVRARGTTGWQIDVKSDYVPSRLTIEDIGKN